MILDDIDIAIKTLKSCYNVWSDQVPNDGESISDGDAIEQAIRCLKEYRDTLTTVKKTECVVTGYPTNFDWHPCEYEGVKLIIKDDYEWIDGRWYMWKDKYGNIEKGRMKLDAMDHFFPDTKIIKEDDVIAFKEIENNPFRKYV